MNIRNLLQYIKEHYNVHEIIIKKVDKNYTKEYKELYAITEYMKNKKVLAYTINFLYDSLVIYI